MKIYAIKISLEIENEKELNTVINVLKCTMEEEIGIPCHLYEIESEEL